MKFFCLFLITLFLLSGYFLDITTNKTTGDVLFCLGGGKIERLTTSLEYIEKKKFKELIYMSKKAHITWQLKRENKPSKLLEAKYNKIIFTKYFKNTLDELLYIEKYIKKNNIKKFSILSDSPHSKRIDILIQNFTDIKADYSILASNNNWWNKYFYFTNWYAIKFVFLELIKIPYNIIKYGLILS